MALDNQHRWFYRFKIEQPIYRWWTDYISVHPLAKVAWQGHQYVFFTEYYIFTNSIQYSRSILIDFFTFLLIITKFCITNSICSRRVCIIIVFKMFIETIVLISYIFSPGTSPEFFSGEGWILNFLILVYSLHWGLAHTYSLIQQK